MLTQRDYCDYDTCVALKELGIGWEDVPEKWAKRYFFIRIPLYETQKWLREEKRIEVNAFYDNTDTCWRFYILEIDSPDLSGTYAYKDAYVNYTHLKEGA